MSGDKPAKHKFKVYLIGYFQIDIAEVHQRLQSSPFSEDPANPYPLQICPLHLDRRTPTIKIDPYRYVAKLNK